MNLPTIHPSKKRRHHARPQTASPSVGPLTLLAAQIVGYQDDALVVSLIFDTTEEDPLAETAHDATQWTATAESVAYTGGSIEAGAFNELQLILPPGGTIAPVVTPTPTPTMIEKPKRARAKAVPSVIAAARELRDRYLEQVNAEPSRVVTGKYDVSKSITTTATTRRLVA